MVCFELWVNGVRQYAAGLPAGHLHGHLHYWGRPGAGADAAAGVSFSGRESAAADWLSWGMRRLEVGDVVLVRVVERAAADEPADSKPHDPAEDEARERAEYERLRAKFG